MRKTNQHHIQFRYGLITIMIVVFSAVLSYKLFSTTIVDASHWNEIA